MFSIVYKEALNPTVTLIEVNAPRIASRAQPGQFVILRVHDQGERIPLTIADFDPVKGTITLIFQIVGATTFQLNELKAGDALSDLCGPLGRATQTQGLQKVAVIGGGVGCAIALPIAKKLSAQGAVVHSITGFKNRDLVLLQPQFAAVSTALYLMTDDGSAGEAGLVTDKLRSLLESGESYDEVIAIGPLIMMKFVCQLTKEYGVKTTVSMNPIMIDGTGMCGGCRLTVGGETRFACVDGPDFDGHLVDFDEAMERARLYTPFECHSLESCRLMKEAKA